MLRQCLAVSLSISLLFTGMVAPASAAIIDTQDAIALDAGQKQLTEVQSLLAREDVRRALVLYGVNPEQAIERVAFLSDTELAQLHGELDTLPAGGSILALIGAVFVVLLILELVGVTNVFSKV
jgi:hypothetical protein